MTGATGKELVQAVRSVAGGGAALGPEATQRIMAQLRDPVGVADPLAALSSQEKRVLELVGEGLTNRQIAERMFLVEKTVKNNVSSMLTKLGMHRRAQAAALAARLAGPVGLASAGGGCPGGGTTARRVDGRAAWVSGCGSTGRRACGCCGEHPARSCSPRGAAGLGRIPLSAWAGRRAAADRGRLRQRGTHLPLRCQRPRPAAAHVLVLPLKVPLSRCQAGRRGQISLARSRSTATATAAALAATATTRAGR